MSPLLYTLLLVFAIAFIDATVIRSKRQGSLLDFLPPELRGPSLPGIDPIGFSALAPLLYGQAPSAPNPWSGRTSPVNFGPPINSSALPDVAWLNPDIISQAARPQAAIGSTNNPQVLGQLLIGEGSLNKQGALNRNASALDQLRQLQAQTGTDLNDIVNIVMYLHGQQYSAQQISGLAREQGYNLTPDQVQEIINTVEQQQKQQEANTKPTDQELLDQLYQISQESNVPPDQLIALAQRGQLQGWSYDQIASYGALQGIKVTPQQVKALLESPLGALPSLQNNVPAQPLGNLSGRRKRQTDADKILLNQVAQQAGISAESLRQMIVSARDIGLTSDEISQEAKKQGISLSPAQVDKIAPPAKQEKTPIKERDTATSAGSLPTLDQLSPALQARLQDASKKANIPAANLLSLAQKSQDLGYTPEQVADLAKGYGVDVTPDEVRQLQGKAPATPAINQPAPATPAVNQPGPLTNVLPNIPANVQPVPNSLPLSIGGNQIGIPSTSLPANSGAQNVGGFVNPFSLLRPRQPVNQQQTGPFPPNPNFQQVPGQFQPSPGIAPEQWVAVPSPTTTTKAPSKGIQVARPIGDMPTLETLLPLPPVTTPTPVATGNPFAQNNNKPSTVFGSQLLPNQPFKVAAPRLSDIALPANNNAGLGGYPLSMLAKPGKQLSDIMNEYGPQKQTPNNPIPPLQQNILRSTNGAGRLGAIGPQDGSGQQAATNPVPGWLSSPTRLDCTSTYQGPFPDSRWPGGYYVDACNHIIPATQLQQQGQLPKATTTSLGSGATQSQARLMELSRQAGIAPSDLVNLIKQAKQTGLTNDQIAAYGKQNGVNISAQDVQDIMQSAGSAPAPAAGNTNPAAGTANTNPDQFGLPPHAGSDGPQVQTLSLPGK